MGNIRKLLPVLVGLLVVAMSGVANAGPLCNMLKNGIQRRHERREDGRGIARAPKIAKGAAKAATAPVRWIGGGRRSAGGRCAGGSCNR